MKHVPVANSSWIESIAYEDGVLEIKAKGGRTMTYRGTQETPLTESEFKAFLASESKGKFYNQFIKKVYPQG